MPKARHKCEKEKAVTELKLDSDVQKCTASLNVCKDCRTLIIKKYGRKA